MNSTKQQYVRMTAYGAQHFGWKYPSTAGNVYTFPNITFDDGSIIHLNENPGAWTREFKFLTEEETIKEKHYEIY